MSINSINSKNFNFGSLASIRKQAEEIKQRAGAQSAARRAEHDNTGLIKNPDTGEMVELSSISDETRERWENREEMSTISLGEAYILFMASDPNAETVERAKELGAKFAKLQDKLRAGQKLNGDEKKFLRENYPELAALADRMEQEAAQLEKKLQGCKSKDDAQRIYMEAKMRIMGEMGKKDGSDGGIEFLMAAIDKAYSDHLGRGNSSKHKIDVWG